MMKIGYNEATALKCSTLELDLKLTEKYGYDYIEIRFDMLQEYLESHSMEDLKKFFLKSKVKPYALNAIEPINFFEGEELENLKKEVEDACIIAQEISNPYIVVVPSSGDHINNYTYEEIKADSIRILDILAKISEKYNVKLAFEPIGKSNCAVKSIKQGWEIVKAIDRDSVGLVIDIFNLYLYDKLRDVDDIYEVDPDKIFVFHIDDSEDRPLEELDHCHRVMPGDGVIDMNPLIKALDKLGFFEIASIELFNPMYWEMPPEEVIKIGKEKTEEAIRKAIGT